jgi:nitric oxide reductase NorD protein
MADDQDDNQRGNRKGLLDRLGGLSLGDAAELLILTRDRIRENPVEHAKAATDVTRALSEARRKLDSAAFSTMQRTVLAVARRDWAAAAVLTEALVPLVEAHPDSVGWVGEAVARAVHADRTLARQLARVLPDCAARVQDQNARSRIITALADLCRRHPGLGLAALPTVRSLLDDGSEEGLATFLEDALDRASRSESVARSFLLRESRSGQEAWNARKDGLGLDSVARTLRLYAEAHLGRAVHVRSTAELPGSVPLAAGAVAHTDGKTLFVVPRIDRFVEDEDNFRLYKVAVAHEVGRIEFATFSLEPFAVPGLDAIVLGEIEPSEGDPRGDTRESASGPLERFAARFTDKDLSWRLLLFAEDLRVDACLRRTYPGLARDLERLSDFERDDRPELDDLQGADLMFEMLARWLWFGEALPEGDVYKRFHEASWLLQALRHPGAGVQDSAGVAAALYPLLGGVGSPRGDEADAEDPLGALTLVFEARGLGNHQGQDAGQFGDGESEAEGELVIVPPGTVPDDAEDAPSTTTESSVSSSTGAGENAPGASFLRGAVLNNIDAAQRQELEARARRIQTALEARGISSSLAEILEILETSPDVSDQSIERNMSELHRLALRDQNEVSERQELSLREPGLKLFEYPEWDEQIRDYRPLWCKVWERRAGGNAGVFVDSVLAEHRSTLRRLRREFQMLRPEALGLQRRVAEGDLLDLDALVGELVDQKRGGSGEGRVYIRTHRKVRDVAVAFLVDLSASTRESVGGLEKSIIEVEKQALVLMSEALEVLGDRYGIFGFSGRGREMVSFDIFKDFNEPLGDIVRGRIGAMTYRMENRDGAAIRHATRRLLEVDARTRLLVLLSDGKPLDCGCDLYQSSYAQSDTKMALREARNSKVHPFCITVDPAGEDYLPQMYGDVRYVVIDSVEELPERLPTLYRKLTSR